MEKSGREFVVGEDEAGVRLDLVLARRLAVGRAQVKRILAAGEVRLDGRRASERDKGLLLSPGMRVEVGEGLAGGIDVVTPAPEMELAVLAEGDGWVAVDKPAGVAVHPLSPGERGTVLNAAVARWPDLQGVGEGGLRSGVVHRLDMETSGVLLLARRNEVWSRLRAGFEEHRTQKLYRAIVAGQVPRDGRKEMDLVIAQHKPARVRVVESVERRRPAGARRCDLSWRVVEKLRGATLLEVSLGTGFLHQIRVMLAHLGHPVLGDRVYGAERVADMAPRQMLHAWRVTLGEMDVKSPDPGDFAGVVGRLRG